MKQQTKKILATAVLLTCYSVPAWSETDIKTAQPDTQEEIRRLKNLIENNYNDKLIIMGRSLGSASACEIISQHENEIDGCIIESGFATEYPLLTIDL